MIRNIWERLKPHIGLILAGVASAGIAYYLFTRPSGGSGAQTISYPGGSGASGGGSGGGGDTTPTLPTIPTPTTPTTPGDWLTKTFAGIIATPGAGGVPVYATNQNLNDLLDYLNGRAQYVSSGAVQLWDYLVIVGGAPPGGFTPPTVAPGNPPPSLPTTVLGWLQTTFGQISTGPGNPSFVNNQAYNELLNYVQGRVTTVSQDAYNLWAYIVTRQGAPPGGFVPPTVTPTTPPSGGPTGPTVTLTDIQSWQNLWFTATENFNTWVQDAPKTIQSTFSIDQLRRIFAYYNRPGFKPTNDQVVTQLNAWLANPSSIPVETPKTSPPVQPGSATNAKQMTDTQLTNLVRGR